MLVFPAAAFSTHSVYEQIATRASAVGLSTDGSLVVLSTDQQFSPADTDSQYDLYLTPGGGNSPALVSTGPAGGNGAFGAYFVAMSEDAQHIFFQTREPLVSADTDTNYDLYESFGGTRTLVSTGSAGGNGPYDLINFFRVSADGTHVFFDTQEALVAGDQDTRPDLYERSGGVTSLVTTGPNGGNGAFDGNCEQYTSHGFSGYTCDGAVSRDGTKVFFPTKEHLVTSDTDSEYDFYERSGGTTTLVTTGPNGGNGPFTVCIFGFHPKCAPQISSDGSRVFFETNESLVGADSDSGCYDGFGRPSLCQDIYERSGGTTTLISTGPTASNGTYDAGLENVSEEGDVLFTTAEALVAGDDNGTYDVYERIGGTTTQVSRGPTGSGSEYGSWLYPNARFAGDRVVFRSSARLTSQDTDSAGDLYESSNGALTLLTIGPAGGNDDSFNCCESWVTSQDGTRVLFVTNERLVSDDVDSWCTYPPCFDLYESYGGGVSLVNDRSQGALYSSIDGARISEDGSKIVYATTQPASPSVWRASLTASGNGYARPRAATPTLIRLVPAFAQCNSANATHGAPLAVPSCTPPRLASDWLTIGTPDSNGQPANFTGYLKLTAVGESPINTGNGDQADVQITSQITGVRREIDLSDYTGDLSYVISLRRTDRLNGAGLDQPATVVDVPLRIPNTYCAATGDSSGSICETSSSLDAVMPGLVTEGKRAVWQLGQVQVFDGGPDDDAATTGDNTLFLTQGLFAP
jgi:hypothetical protein